MLRTNASNEFAHASDIPGRYPFSDGQVALDLK